MRCASRTTRRGTTLLELIVVLVILATAAAITALALTAHREAPAPGAMARIADARRRAVKERQPVHVTVGDTGDRHDVLALPDGRVLGARRDGIDAVTGRPTHATR